jgi:hypothetical protein
VDATSGVYELIMLVVHLDNEASGCDHFGNLIYSMSKYSVLSDYRSIIHLEKDMTKLWPSILLEDKVGDYVKPLPRGSCQNAQ